ncbi:MAG: hypothetical protein C4523_15365 [Myxococcales bacterium]|nr:MAG: hypothetical protein C4523_15365 [Myxococcales bacterium]
MELHCRQCGAPMRAESYEGVRIDVCPDCHGVWLDDGELGRIVEIREAKIDPIPPERLIRAKKRTGRRRKRAAAAERSRLCPKCGQAMDAVPYQYSSDIVIDVCPARHGVWLDASELEAVQAYAEGGQDLQARLPTFYEALPPQTAKKAGRAYSRTMREAVSPQGLIGWLVEGIVYLDEFFSRPKK